MIRFFAGHPTAGNLLMVGFLALGVIAATSVKRETFPDIPSREVQVTVPFPGATAEEVESGICRRIEDAVDGVDGLDEKRCEAREGLAQATLEMREGGDIDRFLDDVKSEIDAIDTFPDDAEQPVVKQLGRVDFVATIAVAGPMAAPDLKAYAESLKDRMLQIPGVSQVEVQGFSEHQIRIEVPATTLRQLGLSVDQLADVVARQSIDMPSGSVETRDSTVLIRFADERRTPRALADLVVVGGGAGGEIRLGDIATIEDRFELAEEKVLFNGQRAAYLVVNKSKSDDTLDVVDALKAFVAAEKAVAPPTVSLTVTQDISSIVRDRLNMLIRNGGQGLLLVFLTMWVFFSLRFSFWVAMGLPVSFMGTIAGMAVIGYSFDMITLVALLIAIGLLMDDAIVLSENIARHFAMGKLPLQAAIDGAAEVGPGVFSSFLTTVAIFGGLAFLTGNMGHVLKVMPVILILTLAVSLVEAFLILPHHLKGSLGHLHKPPAGWIGKTRARINGAIEWLREGLAGRLVDAAVRQRYLFVGLVISLFLVSVAMVAGGILKFRAFPDLEGDVVEARLLLPQGTPLARTEMLAGRLVAAMGEIDAELTPRQPGGQHLVRNIGVQFSKNADAYETGPHLATVAVDLLSAEVRDARMDEVIALWRQKMGALPDVISLKFTESVIGPAGRAIDVRLRGADLDELKAASLTLQSWFNGYVGVNDLIDDLRPGKPEIRVHLRPGATALGLTAAGIAAQLRSAFYGKTAMEVQVGPESYEINIRLAEADRDTLADLDYFTVTAANGRQVPLDTVAVLELGRGYARINRIDGLRTVTLQGDVDTTRANTAEILRDVQRRVPELNAMYPGVHVDFSGEAEETAKTSGSMMRNFVIGLFAVFLILSFQFRSYIEPILVMVAIPLGLIGAVWGHLLTGLDLSMPSMLGLASLAGVVVNNSILLVNFVKIEMAEGRDIVEAAGHASRQRFRAILLTTLTTVAGLLPLLTETSLQAQVVIPLVTSLAFGLFVATVLVLFVIPALYVILHDLGLTAGQREEVVEEAAE
ncbi:MAG: efflux RND transporter permease subunit [Hyphomicrobiales bacterium]|nr:efflux RND transporter permease subunit [Hyphomicrobiales bacterium]